MSDSSDDGSPNESFFGLIVKPNKRYDTVVKKAFRISKACIEPATMEGDKVTSLYLEYDGDEFIIANLYKGQMSENLDLSFNLNEKISFKVDGPGIVHLTGNTIDEDMAPGLMDDFSDEEMESEDEEVETPEPKQKKRKNEANKKDAKKIKLDSTATSNGKADDEESSSDDDDDSSDETGADTTTLSELDSTANFAEEEDSDESEDDSEEGEEEEEEGSDDDDSEEESEAEEESPAKPAKTNGDVSPSKKAKLEAKAKTESPKKNVEMTPKNKKEGKPDKTPKQESKTPKAEVKTPKAEAKTPKQDGKTPKQDGKTPKPESKTPKQESKTPKQESKTPKQEGKTPKQEGKTPKTPKPENKLLKDQGAATPKSAKKFSVGGVTIEDLRVGTGPDVKKGKMVGMYYAGRLQSNNKQFDACQSGKPFKFRLGAGEVIKGWDTGIMGMKVGGKRRLTIPAPLAYGSKGAPPDIPPNATLVFEIECKFCN